MTVNPFLQALPDLVKLSDTIWDELLTSVGNPNLPWGLGVLGTLGSAPDKMAPRPEVRRLVLRGAERESYSLIWHTDQRSPKIQQLQENQQSSVLFWNPELRVQLTLGGETNVVQDSKIVAAEWNRSQLTSRRAYLGKQAPGTKTDQLSVNFPHEFQNRPPTESESRRGFDNFSVLRTTVQEMDLLILRQSGNVRAKFSWDEEQSRWNASWVCP